MNPIGKLLEAKYFKSVVGVFYFFEPIFWFCGGLIFRGIHYFRKNILIKIETVEIWMDARLY